MATTSPIRIEDELHASAKTVAPVMSRSVAQQIAHWARIGRELEASPTVSHADIAEVLAGARHYDSLGVREQAIVRAEWAEAMSSRIENLDLAAEFVAAARSYVELDDDGNVAVRDAGTDPA